MSMTLGTYGNSIYLGSGSFDLSQNTSLEIQATSPSNATKTFTGVTAPAEASPDIPDVGVLPANQYGLYNTLEDDFDEAGTWDLKLIYINTAATPPQRFIGGCLEYEVEDCD